MSSAVPPAQKHGGYRPQKPLKLNEERVAHCFIHFSLWGKNRWTQTAIYKLRV